MFFRCVPRAWCDRLERKINYIMSALDDIKTAFVRVSSDVTNMQSTIATDTASIRDLSAQLASAQTASAGAASETDLSGIATQLNTLADSIEGKVSTVATSTSNAASTVAAAPSS